MSEREVLLDVQELSVDFRIDRKTTLRAVREVSFQVYKGETLGILGESGCGKSVTCMSILRLEPEKTTRYPSGRILSGNQDLLTLATKELGKIRGNEIGMIFQEPMTAMNPLFTIGDQMMEVLRIHHPHMEKGDAYERCIRMIENVKIPNPQRIMKSYPFSLSGGMLQRIMIGMAMLNRPKLLICDEPTTALDVTIQAQVLDLMNQLKQEQEMSIIFVTHDLGVISEMADRVMVMYGGRKCEEALATSLFQEPLHPYTQGLIRSHPQPGEKRERLEVIPGSVPALKDMPAGCPFHNRCPYASDECKETFPVYEEALPDHWVACHHWRKAASHG